MKPKNSSNFETSKYPNLTGHECQFCGMTTKGARSKIQGHVTRHEPPAVLKCTSTKCKQKFTSTADLKKHAAEHLMSLPKLEERSYMCEFPDCNYASKKPSLLRNHNQRMHRSGACVCHLCGKKFKNISNVAQHTKKFHDNQQGADVWEHTSQGLEFILKDSMFSSAKRRLRKSFLIKLIRKCYHL